MKNVYLTVIAFLSSMICISGCSSSEEETLNPPQPGEKMIITASHGNASTSRVAYPAEGDGLTMNWTANDAFALYGDDRQEFTLLSGENTATGEFNGTTPAGTPSKAFYPFLKSDEDNWNDCVIDITGQKQTVSGNMGHLPDYTFMTGNLTVGDDLKKTVKFEHQTTLMKFVLTLPGNITTGGETLKTFHLSTNQENAFTVKKGVGTNSTITEEKRTVISMDISGMTVINDKITLYMMVLPFNLNENSKLILTIDTETTSGEGRYYDFTATIGSGGKSYEAGFRYTAEVELEPIVYPIADGDDLYPTKVTNLTTSKFFYIAVPFGNNKYGPIGVAQLVFDNDWDLPSARYYNTPGIQIDDMLGVSVPINPNMVDVTNLPVSGFVESFGITGNSCDFWLQLTYNGEMRSFGRLNANGQICLLSTLANSDILKKYVRLVRVKNM